MKFVVGELVFWVVGKKRFEGIVMDVNPKIAPGSLKVEVWDGEVFYPLIKFVHKVGRHKWR